MIEHVEPKAMADTIEVFCAHDKIVDIDELVGNPRNQGAFRERLLLKSNAI